MENDPNPDSTLLRVGPLLPCASQVPACLHLYTQTSTLVLEPQSDVITTVYNGGHRHNILQCRELLAHSMFFPECLQRDGNSLHFISGKAEAWKVEGFIPVANIS